MSEITINEGIKVIEAYENSDGFRTLSLALAQKRQRIIINGNKPCDECKCSGQVIVGPPMREYAEVCKTCKGKGFLIPKVIYE